MPVLRIHGLRTDNLDVPTLLRTCSEGIAEAFACPVEQCWALFVEVADGEYFEGGVYRTKTGSHSPVAVLSSYQGREASQVSQALRNVAEAVTSAYGFDRGDVFVEFRELAAGQVVTGGDVR